LTGWLGSLSGCAFCRPGTATLSSHNYFSNFPGMKLIKYKRPCASPHARSQRIVALHITKCNVLGTKQGGTNHGASTACFLNKVYLKDPLTCFDPSNQWKNGKSSIFSIFFLIFSEFPRPPSRSRSNSRCHRYVPGGLGTMVWSWLQGPTSSGDLQLIFPNFLMCISCSPSSN
jgi:hypothetical protein